MKILFLGDIVGTSGCEAVKRFLPKKIKENNDSNINIDSSNESLRLFSKNNKKISDAPSKKAIGWASEPIGYGEIKGSKAKKKNIFAKSFFITGLVKDGF